MTPIIAVFMSMISLLALVADRANLQEQGDSIPLPSVDDGVSRNFLDVAKRTVPLKMTPARSINLRRLPRAARGPTPRPAPGSLTLVLGEGVPDGVQLHPEDAVLLKSLLIHALRKRDIRDQVLGETSKASTSSSSSRGAKSARSSSSSVQPGPTTRTRPALQRPQRPNSLGELKEDLMAHGRDRELLRRRWKIQNAKHRIANVHG